MADHPSAMALDMLALGDAPPEVKTHVDGCAQCKAHVALVSTPAVLPPDLRVRALERRPTRSLWAWLGGGFALAATAALALILVPVDDPGIREKGGGPAIELFVKRGDTVQLWEPKSPITAGDRLLLRVDPAGYTHARVLAAGGGVLFDGELPDQSAPLPVSFKVDGAEGDERLRIELSGGGKPGWVTHLDLPKAQ